MPSAAFPSRVEMIEYDAFGQCRPARVELPAGEPSSMALILSGVAMFGLDAELPATRGLLEFGDLLGHLDIARRGGEHFGQLDLPRMQVEPPVRLGQHGAREISDREIVPLAQVIGQRGADIRAG